MNEDGLDDGMHERAGIRIDEGPELGDRFGNHGTGGRFMEDFPTDSIHHMNCVVCPEPAFIPRVIQGLLGNPFINFKQ